MLQKECSLSEKLSFYMVKLKWKFIIAIGVDY